MSIATSYCRLQANNKQVEILSYCLHVEKGDKRAAARFPPLSQNTPPTESCVVNASVMYQCAVICSRLLLCVPVTTLIIDPFDLLTQHWSPRDWGIDEPYPAPTAVSRRKRGTPPPLPRSGGGKCIYFFEESGQSV